MGSLRYQKTIIRHELIQRKTTTTKNNDHEKQRQRKTTTTQNNDHEKQRARKTTKT
jgi:hypothetical protein